MMVNPKMELFFTGYHYMRNNKFGFIVVKLGVDGQIDKSFGDAGKAESPYPTDRVSNIQDLVELPGGDIAAVGYTNGIRAYMPSLTLIQENGKYTEGFNFDGYIEINFNEDNPSNDNRVEYFPETGTAVIIGSSKKKLALASVKLNYVTNVKENSMLKQNIVYPNPSSGEFHIKSEMNISYFEIRSIDGKLLKQGSGSFFSLTALPAGIYVGTFSDGTKTYRQLLNKI